MIICKWQAYSDDYLQKASLTTTTTTSTSGVTWGHQGVRGDGTEGGEEGKGEGEERGEEERKLLRTGRDGTTLKAL